MTTTRISLTLPDDMREALAELSRQRGASMSNLVRLAVADMLEAEGYEVERFVAWGGDRVTVGNNKP